MRSIEYNQLTQSIFREMKPKLENNHGLFIFAQGRAKFEGKIPGVIYFGLI